MSLETKDTEEKCVFIFEDEKITANKFMLTCNSPVFELMFYGPMAANKIQITDIKADDFKQMLDYIHTKDITPKSIPNSWSLFYISQKYFLNSLKKVCLDYISLNLTLSTLLLSYEYAQLYNLKELACKCWREILLSAKEILSMDYHMKATTFCTLLDENAINANEEDLVEAAIKWATNECLINNLDPTNKCSLLIKTGIFQRLRFSCLGRASCNYIYQLTPNDSETIIPLINQNSEKRYKITMSLGLRYRFREAYKIERNIPLLSENEFYCTLQTSCKIVVYGIAIAQPHQDGFITAFSNVVVTIFDSSNKLLGKTEHDIVTQGDYESPDLVHFLQSIQFESNVPYRICVKYNSNCKKPNELLCYYLSHCIQGHRNSVKLQFDDELCGGVVRGISYCVI